MVHFDHVLDVAVRGLQLAVNFAYTQRPLTLAMIKQFFDGLQGAVNDRQSECTYDRSAN